MVFIHLRMGVIVVSSGRLGGRELKSHTAKELWGTVSWAPELFALDSGCVGAANTSWRAIA